jgi:putative serine protease PepD
MQGSDTPVVFEEQPAHDVAGAPVVSAEPGTGAPDDRPAPDTTPLGTGPTDAWQAPTWAPGYGYQTPMPQYGGGMPPVYPPIYPSQPPRRRRPVGLALALIVMLLLGLGVGVALGHGGSGASPSSGTTVIGAQSAPALTVSSTNASLQQDLENVAKAVEPSVVKITSTSANQEAVGSGDIITANGYIVTNDHVVDGFTNFTVTLSNGKTYTATLVGQDPGADLAVVKISATGLTPIAFADSSKVTVGEFAVAVGNPLDLQESSTLGTVSAVNGVASEAPSGPAGTLTGLIQTTATIAPGNSGGALVNLQGQLIGIPTLEETNPDTRSASGIGYAIASDEVQTIAQQLIQHGSVTTTGQPFIGIQAQDVTPQLAAADGLSVQSGVLVGGFVNDTAGQSPAQQAGLRTGDVIIAVNGTTVNDNSDLSAALANHKPGDKVTLTIVRGTSQSDVTVTLGERPANLQG